MHLSLYTVCALWRIYSGSFSSRLINYRLIGLWLFVMISVIILRTVSSSMRNGSATFWFFNVDHLPKQHIFLLCVPAFDCFLRTLLSDHHPLSFSYCKTYHTIWKHLYEIDIHYRTLFATFERFYNHRFIFKTNLDRRQLLTMCFHDDQQKERVWKHLLFAWWCLIVQYWNFVSLFGRLWSTCSHLSHIDSTTHTVLIKSVQKLYSHTVYVQKIPDLEKKNEWDYVVVVFDFG